jgi:Tfp pilus assembly protein PilF
MFQLYWFGALSRAMSRFCFFGRRREKDYWDRMADSRKVRKSLILGALIVLANLLVYRQVLSFAPVNLDEQQLLGDNWRYLRTGSSAAAAFKRDVFKTADGTFYRPLLTLSFMADAGLAGDKFDPAPFYRSNLLIQLFNALLCFILFTRFIRPEELAAAGALVFSLHPALAAASGWIPGRNDSLLFTFSALSLLCLTEAVRRHRAGLFAAHLLSFFLALFVKETAAVLLPLFPVWAYISAGVAPLAGKWKVKAAVVAGWAFCAGAYLFLRAGALNGGNLSLIPDLHSLLSRTAAYAAYVFVPVNIPVYAWFRDLSVTRIILADGAALLFFLPAWRPRKGLLLPCALAGLAFSIVPSAFSDRFLPHRLYLPVFFFALALSEAGRAFYPEKKIAAPLLLTVSLCLGYMTFHSLRRFRDPDTFWQNAYALSPSCAEAAYELGYSAQLRGEAAVAEKYYLKAIAANPLVHDARLNLGVLYKQAGRYDEALGLYTEELKLSPGRPAVLENIANLLAAKGDLSGAAGYYELKIAAEPDACKTYESLILCLHAAGNDKEAARYRDLLKKRCPPPR